MDYPIIFPDTDTVWHVSGFWNDMHTTIVVHFCLVIIALNLWLEETLQDIINHWQWKNEHSRSTFLLSLLTTYVITQWSPVEVLSRSCERMILKTLISFIVKSIELTKNVFSLSPTSLMYIQPKPSMKLWSFVFQLLETFKSLLSNIIHNDVHNKLHHLSFRFSVRISATGWHSVCLGWKENFTSCIHHLTSIH